MPAKSTKKKPTASAPKGVAKPHFATRAGTGSSLHADVADGRAIWARRGREVYAKIVSDLGGADLQSELAAQSIRRAVGLIILAEQAEAKLANNEEIEVEKHISVINAFNRTASALGLARVARDVTPSLQQYVRDRASNIAAEADEDAELPTYEKNN